MSDVRVSVEPEIPLLRGLLHAVSCPVALIAGGVLAWLAPTPRAALALLVMSTGFAAIFGTSGIYHRISRRWSPTARRRARQADHAMIFVGMASAYTAIWLVALDGWISDVVLVYCWIAATLGVISKIWFLDARPSRHVAMYVGMGLVGLVVVPSLWTTMGATGVAMMLVGGTIITLGGIVFAYQRPNPIPGWLGHHELFHAGTVIGCGLFLAAMATFALR
jgi:hemolysin III